MYMCIYLFNKFIYLFEWDNISPYNANYCSQEESKNVQYQLEIRTITWRTSMSLLHAVLHSRPSISVFYVLVFWLRAPIPNSKGNKWKVKITNSRNLLTTNVVKQLFDGLAYELETLWEYQSINQSINQFNSSDMAHTRTRETDEQTESSRQEEQHNTKNILKHAEKDWKDRRHMSRILYVTWDH